MSEDTKGGEGSSKRVKRWKGEGGVRLWRGEQREVGGRGEEKVWVKKEEGSTGRRPGWKGGGARALTRSSFRAPRPRVGLAASCLLWSEDAAVGAPPPQACDPHTRASRFLGGKADIPQA